MRIISKITFFIFLLSLYSSSAMAASDLRLWLEAGLRYRITKKLHLGFDQHVRFDDDVSHVEEVSPEIFVRYRVVKFFRVGGGYRLIFEPLSDNGNSYTDIWHRFFVDFLFSHTMKPVTLRYRLRFQEQFGWPQDKTPETLQVKHTVRNKLGIHFNLGKGFTPFIAGEVFGRFGDKDGFLHKWRATSGLDYGYKSNEFTFFIGSEGLLDKSDEPTRIIFGLGYHYIF
ncbi:MAG: DUF2490 domain-containing protein [Pseudomonadota bacterium]